MFLWLFNKVESLSTVMWREFCEGCGFRHLKSSLQILLLIKKHLCISTRIIVSHVWQPACGLSLCLGSPLPSDLWVISFLPYTKILARQGCLVWVGPEVIVGLIFWSKLEFPKSKIPKTICDNGYWLVGKIIVNCLQKEVEDLGVQLLFIFLFRFGQV